MSAGSLLGFLDLLGSRRDLLAELNTKGKDEVIAAAAELGYGFSASDYDAVVWPLEAELAKKRGEEFDAHFPLWQLMWGRHYLEFVVDDVLPSFTAEELDRLRAGGTRS